MNTNVTQQATIIGTYSQRMLVKTSNNEVLFAKIKGKKIQPVCGDQIEISPIAQESDWLINKIIPRNNELTRSNYSHKREVIAANITMIAVVVSDPPKPDWFIVDRYIGAAESMGIKACIICNKIDLNWETEQYSKTIKNYQLIGYPVIYCSAETKSNLEKILEHLKNETAIFVGQSGAGKSSIINQISRNSNQLTQEISSKKKEGKHTTVNSNILDLDNGGKVMDSPGVRDYSPIIDSTYKVVGSFVEIEAEGLNCKFNNCSHAKEQNCAVKEAVNDERIDPRRYESYKRLLNITQKNNHKRY
ncbi:MAG: ribosome biogenesis GTPase [Woeseiaceae bacterium]|jgi:ribosome biogenesis GTPase|tara:strand:- start:16310 stop:17221 length:912 start_codon:yes stop_codon:yes gene_type:complete